MSMLLSLLLSLLVGVDAPTIKIDLSPLKEPLDKAAASFDRAVKLAEQTQTDLVRALHWSGLVFASLITALTVNIYHSRQLYLRKEDRRP